MDTIAEHTKDKRFYNFLTICFGLELFTKGIYDFVVDNIKKEHKRVYTLCASGACTRQTCSKRFKKFRDWCPSCSKWKAELKKIKSDECRHWDIINWQNLNSSDWSQSIDEMAKVFVKVKNEQINYRHGVFYDFCAVMSILTNMNIFSFDKIILKEIKRIRNEYYGHNSTNSVHDAEKNIFFDRILNFIRLEKIRGYQSAIHCIPALEKLPKIDLKNLFEKDGLNDFHDNQMKKFPIDISPDRALVFQNEILANSQFYSYFKSRLEGIIVKDELKKESEVDNRSVLKKQIKLWTTFKIKCKQLLRCLLFSALFVQVLEKPPDNLSGCLDLRLHQSWMSDIEYVQELNHDSLRERDRIKDGERSVLKREDNLLLSKLGFGKSATFSEMLCADVYSPWNHIRTMTIAYHMCRSNEKDSPQFSNFIHSLAKKVDKNVYGINKKPILVDEYALDYLDFKCMKDPFGGCYRCSFDTYRDLTTISYNS